MAGKRMVTIVVHRDGELEGRTYRLSVSSVRFLKWSAATLGTLVVVAAVLYMPIARTASRVPDMNREMARLRSENEQVRQLARQQQENARTNKQRRRAGGEQQPGDGRVHDEL